MQPGIERNPFVKKGFRHYGLGNFGLVQIGPGIMSLNDTKTYTWGDFRHRSVTAVQRLLDAYPGQGQLKVTSLLLRYIDAVEFDHTKEDVYGFLRDKLKVSVALPSDLFEDTGIAARPKHFHWETSFASERPSGGVMLRFATGHKDGKPALIWESLVHSDAGLPELPDRFCDWLDPAHTVLEDWFFKLIDGDLERRFRGD